MPHTWKCVTSLHDIDSCSCLELVINSPYQYHKIQNDMKNLHLQSTVPILQSNPFGQVPASIPTPLKAMWYLVLIAKDLIAESGQKWERFKSFHKQ